MLQDNGKEYIVFLDKDIIGVLEQFRVYCDHQYENGPRRWKSGDVISFSRDQRLRPYSCYLVGDNLWDCGEYSYSQSTMPMDVSCGRYCSISWGVKVSGWQHPVSAVTTSLVSCNPSVRFVRQALADQDIARLALAEAPQKSRPRLGNDVWIGMDVTLMAGIEIGDGAIIASGSVVTRNVEPYAIVGGNPARLIRWRFSEHIRTRLQRLGWWRFNIRAFSDLDMGDVDRFVEQMERRESSLEEWTPPTPLFIKEIAKFVHVETSEDEFNEAFHSHLGRRDFDEAESTCIKWAGSYDKSWRPHDALGHLYSSKEKHDVALIHAQRAIAIAGRTWGHVARLGSIHESLNDLEMAEELFAEAVALPGGERAIPWLQQVRLRQSPKHPARSARGRS